MAGESQAAPKTEPDPSVLTTEQLELAIQNQRRFNDKAIDVIMERFRGMDEAARVLHETVTRIPTDVQREVSHLRELLKVELAAVAQQFKERDVRAERESRDNKITVDAAFAAQEKLGVKQDEANQKSIDKSEKATNEAIAKNADAARAEAKALSDKIEDVKDRLTRVESVKVGVHEQVVEQRASSSFQQQSVTYLIGLVLAAIVIVGFIVANKP